MPQIFKVTKTKTKQLILLLYSCSQATATAHPFPASTCPGSHHLINMLLKLRTMHNCPIIPSITWFSNARRSISSHIWNCSAPDRRGHNSSRPMRRQTSAGRPRLGKRTLTGYPNVHYMRQMMLEALHSLRQFRGISIGGREHRLEREGDDVRHGRMRN